MTPRALPLLAFVAAFALFATTLQSTVFSDGVYLSAKVAAGPRPYYNAFYIPLGWAFLRALAPLVHWDAFTALGWLSALCGAGAVGVLAHDLRRIGISGRWTLAWCALLAVTPGIWFFSTCVEVHSVQLLGATVATHLALVARDVRRGRALALLVAACAVALLSHLTTVLLLPGLVMLARGARSADGVPRGVGLAGLPWRAVLLVGGGVAAVAAAVLIAYSANEGGLSRSNPLAALEVFGRKYVEKIAGGRFYRPGEVADFLRAELVAPAGLLLLAPVVAAFRRPGIEGTRLWLPAVVAALPYALLLPQGGIREGGAYFLSFFPLWGLAAADGVGGLLVRATAPPRTARAEVHVALAFAAALLLQGALGRARWREAEGRLDAREWVRLVERDCPRGTLVLTTSLARFHALKYGDLSSKATRQVDLNRELEMVPRASWRSEVLKNLTAAAQVARGGGQVLLDADFLAPDGPPSHEVVERVLEEQHVALEPVPPDAAEPLVYRLRFP